jgi:hypothetical protein
MRASECKMMYCVMCSWRFWMILLMSSTAVGKTRLSFKLTCDKSSPTSQYLSCVPLVPVFKSQLWSSSSFRCRNVPHKGNTGYLMNDCRCYITKENDRPVPLYSIHANPCNSNEQCVGGRDQYIRLENGISFSLFSWSLVVKVCP